MNDHPVKIAGDIASGLTVLGTLLDKLPAVAAGCAIIWYAVRFAEWARTKWRKRDRSQDGTNY